MKQGQDNCLEGLTFVVTGVLETVDRDDTKSLIERYGGKLTGNVSRNTSYVVVGRDAGESKLAKVFSNLHLLPFEFVCYHCVNMMFDSFLVTAAHVSAYNIQQVYYMRNISSTMWAPVAVE